MIRLTTPPVRSLGSVLSRRGAGWSPAILVLALGGACGEFTPPPPWGGPIDTEPMDGAPSAPVVQLGPAGAHTGEALVLQLNTPAVEPEGQALRYEVRWTLDGAVRSDLDDLWTLDGALSFRGQEWAVAVTAFDPAGHASLSAESALIVADAPAGAPVVRVDPALPLPGQQDLRCILDAAGIDPEGDPVTHTLAWTVDGDPYPETPPATGLPWTGPIDGTLPGDTVPAADVRALSHWECEATPWSLDRPGAVSRAEVYVAAVQPAPDFTAEDVNPNSSRFGQAVSPRDYLEQVSGWYFGHAT